MRWKQALWAAFMSFLLGLTIFSISGKAAVNYKVRVNKQMNTVTVYEWREGKYKPCKAFVCSVGNQTPLGTFRIPCRYRWRPLVASTYGQYATRITGPYLFHSVVYDRPDPSTLFCKEFNKLGKIASHGCIRLSVSDAKWIYDNCPNGTVVEIYQSKDPGSLGKPKAIKVPGKMGYDPTDVWSKGNPYNKKKPKISGAKNKTISYGDNEYDPMEGIRAKNTTGYSAKKLVRYTIKYRSNTADRYVKVKKVDTTKSGLYRITYQLADEIGRKAKVTVVHRVLENTDLAMPTPQPSQIETTQNIISK